MELTRRDAIAALAAAGAVGAGAAVGESFVPSVSEGISKDGGASDSAEAPPEAVLDTLTAAAEVLFPSDIEGHAEFVETYVLGRIEGRESYRLGVVDTASDLNDVARDWQGASFARLDPVVRDRLLRDIGAGTAEPDADGPISERVRYYVVNDLLYAFYSSPTGGRLVGIENPIGHPGGTRSYRRTDAPEKTRDDGGDG